MYMTGHNTPSAQRRGTTIYITNDRRTLRHVPLGDIILHTELRVTTESSVCALRCSCRDCNGG